MVSPLEKAQGDFIEKVGLRAQADGLPRIAGRLMAFLVIHGGPFSLSELAASLQISRASVSTNGRVLANLGILEKVGVPGERQDYYKLAEKPYVELMNGYIERMRQSVTVVDDLETVVHDQAKPDAGMIKRVSEMKAFYEKAIDNSINIVDKL